VVPRSGFAETFAVAAPKDRAGRSLRELNLETRLLRYPCSYMVYSDAFQALPSAARQAVLQRMWAILSGDDARPKYAHLSSDDRRAVIEILRDTMKDLPPAFARQTR
jgi:hypothetical protein